MLSHRTVSTLLLTTAIGLALALAPAAQGKRKKKKEPEPPPPPAVRCTLELQQPDGRTRSVVAWGPDETGARGQARRAARLVAEVHAHPDTWSALLHPDVESTVTFVSRLQRVPTSPEEGMVFPLPGYNAGPPACAPETLPVVAGAAAWEVAWTADAGESIRRDDAATAIEAARRRACFVPYQREIAGMWRALASVEPGQRQELFTRSWGGSRDAFLDCFGASELSDATLTTKVPYPWIRPAAGGTRPEAQAPPEGVIHTGYECLATEFSEPGTGATARGWGTQLEWAQEAAMGSLALAVSRDAFAGVAHGMDATAPEALPALIADQALRLTRVVAPTAGVEEHQLACSTQVARADENPALRWAPAATDVRDLCAPADGWDAAVVPFGDPPASPFDLLLTLQRRQVNPNLIKVREAWAATGGDVAVAMLGLGAAARCEVSSMGEAALERAGTQPVSDGWTALRASPEMSRAVLDNALDGKNLSRLIAVVHPQQRPATLTMYERVLATEGDALPFWEQMGENLPAALEDGRLVWGQFEAGFLLVPVDTP